MKHKTEDYKISELSHFIIFKGIKRRLNRDIF